MEYSQLYFNKNLNDLIIEDIKDFFSQSREESDKLEFKSFSSRGNYEEMFNGICKGICAFLNSEGGLLIWGAPKGKIPVGKKEKAFEGDLEPINLILEKDALISKISDRITPLPSRLKVRIIEHLESCLCIFEIDKSEYSPHQFNNTYYMRIDGQSRPAPHHYVEALFRKVKYPNLEGFIKINETGTLRDDYFLNISIIVFNFSQLQNETNLTVSLICDLGYFKNHRADILGKRYNMNGHQILLENTQEVLHFGNPFYEDDMLIFPKEGISQNNNRANLILTFGGKTSPMKSSEYVLDFNNIDGNNPNMIIFQMNENVLTSEKQNQLGISKDEQLKIILGR